MNQREFTSQGGGLSQADKVLQCLANFRTTWVPMVGLASYSGAYAVHSRVSDLRKRGHKIEHKNERHGKQIHSFYRLV